MKIENHQTKRQLFICCNIREGKEACGSQDTFALIQNLKMRLREEGLWGEYKVSKSGCLGPCAFGVTALLFPENKLITQINLSDEDELYNLLVEKK